MGKVLSNTLGTVARSPANTLILPHNAHRHIRMFTVRHRLMPLVLAQSTFTVTRALDWLAKSVGSMDCQLPLRNSRGRWESVRIRMAQ